MEDVRTIFGAALRAQLVVLVALARARARARADAACERPSREGSSAGALATLAIAVLAVPFILLGFDRFFTRFHELFFEGDSWRFSTTDTLIRIYPERFWEDVSTIGSRSHRGAGAPARSARVVVAASARAGAHGVIELERRDGRVLRIGHRGAALVEPENTLRSFRAAVELGVDLVEFDVLDLPRGPLVIAHSDHLDEVSHGVAVRLRQVALPRGAP